MKNLKLIKNIFWKCNMKDILHFQKLLLHSIVNYNPYKFFFWKFYRCYIENKKQSKTFRDVCPYILHINYNVKKYNKGIL